MKEVKPISIAFIDLGAQQARVRVKLDAAIAKVLDRGSYIMGPEVSELENRLAGFCGAKHAPLARTAPMRSHGA